MSPAFDSPSEAMANTGRRPLFAMAALILVAATLLLGLAAPRLLGGIAQVPGEPIMAAVRQHLDVPLGDLRWAVQSRSTATEWLDSGDLWADAGRAANRHGNNRWAHFDALPAQQLFGWALADLAAANGAAPIYLY